VVALSLEAVVMVDVSYPHHPCARQGERLILVNPYNKLTTINRDRLRGAVFFWRE
jgi:hypothetical protein